MKLYWHRPEYSTVVIMGPGPSLSQEQIALVEASDAFVIAVGEAGRVAYPQADVLYHCDRKWWDYYQGVPDFSGIARVSLEQTDWDSVYQAPRSPLTEGLDLKFPYLVTGNNSGYQAINLAVHFKPNKIILIGYDMKDSADGRHNIVGHHPAEIRRPYDFSHFIQNISTLPNVLEKLGITVYNSTIDTDLKCFPRKELADALRA